MSNKILAFEYHHTSPLSYDDILFCILLRLPVKSLLRFRSVSKLCNATICNEYFKKAYRDHSKVFGREKLLLQRVDTDEFEFIRLKNPQVVIESEKSPIMKNSQVLCSHDGLVLLVSRNAYNIFVLWNPSTRQQKTLKCSYLDNSTCPCASGLCYDSATYDYKVILIYKSFYIVGSTNRNIWRKKTALPILEQSIVSSSLGSTFCSIGISIEGCVYWCRDHKEFCRFLNKTFTIIYFDVKSDQLKKLPTPNFVDKNNKSYRLSTLKDRLILYGGKSLSLKSDIWMMEQDGLKWFKLCNIISASCDYYVKHCYKFLCWTENGEIIFHEPIHHEFYISKVKQKQLVQKIISDNSKNVYCIVNSICLDTLCFPRLY